MNESSLKNLKMFSSEYQPKKNGRHKGRTPTEWLKYFAKRKIRFENPITGQVDRKEVNAIVAIQLILKATQDSDLPSIKEYFDRLDGKVPQEIKGNPIADTKIIIVRDSGDKAKEVSGPILIQRETVSLP